MPTSLPLKRWTRANNINVTMMAVDILALSSIYFNSTPLNTISSTIDAQFQ